jgi:hypothetical protein
MPTRFAEWLQKALLDNFGLVTELNSTKTGLISKPTQPFTEVISEEASLVSKAKGMLNTLFATKEKIITFAITESELAIINENVKKAGFPGSYTMEKFNSLTKEQQEIVKKCYGR